MRRLMMCLGVAAMLMTAGVRADPATEVMDLYRSFATAQNRLDTKAVRALLWNSPDFLWISDGRPYWGPDAMIERMAHFQKAGVWRVEPDYTAARVVSIDANAAYVHVPLQLVIGAKENPTRLKWLVEVLCRKTDSGWRIAGLFTAQDKRS
jgi:ketosteroid isomerase-like protein